MKDIFDIIKDRKDNHIKIKGEIGSSSFSYSLDTINDFINIILNNQEHVDMITFNITENKPSAILANHGIYASAHIPEERSIEFDIDIYVDNYLYDELEDLKDFIYYFTEGSIKYSFFDEAMSTIEDVVSYRARRSIDDNPTVRVNWEDVVSRLAQPVPEYNWNYELDTHWEIGSHDADGDVVYAAEFRATDMTNMFSNMNLTLDRDAIFDIGSYPRPVRRGREH